jgi:integrase
VGAPLQGGRRRSQARPEGDRILLARSVSTHYATPAGSLVAREADAHFLQAFLGHSRMSTTERYLHAKSRPQDLDTLNRAFAGSIAPIREGSR